MATVPELSSGQPLKLRKNKKSLTLRVDDIPADHIHILNHNLKSIFEENPNLQGDADKVVLRSLVRHSNDGFCATISTITSLSADDLSAQLGRAGNGHRYSFTCKFEGITPLHEDENGVDVDIIAVPGLGGHALGSWKSPYSDDVWLRDFLPKDVPNIRVLLYGYDTTLPGSLSKQSIKDLGGALLEQINAYRARDETSHRPIIFIGHSLGGLLIKEALIRARRKRSVEDSIISSASYGILFFGVPNLGLRNGQLRTLVRGQPNEALIHDLLVDNDSEPSTFMKRLADHFSETCKGQYRVVTFFERILSPTLEVDQDGKWRRSGPVALLVTEKSATNTGLVAVADEDNIPLNRDHSGLVKYSSRSQGDYTVVRERLRRLVDEAKQEVATRFAELNLYQPQSEITQACLRSLAFDDMDGRQNKIDAAAKDTCKWLLSHETLIQWTRQYRGLLWIKGKPGSGKSTLLKFALREVPAHYGADTLAFSFFFHGRGHELQRTPLGLFRSILHQLLSRVPGALRDLIDEFEAKRKSVGEPGEMWQWHLQQLQAFLASSLPRILKRFPVVVFIDALDECGEQPAVELIGYLKDLISGLPPTNSRFGIFFSCRHYPIVELDSGSTILLDTENNSDITTYIQTRLSGSYIDAQIQSIISDSAQGVFMWAHFVLERVLQLKRQGESRVKIKTEIKRTPQTLDDLYHGLIQGVENRSYALRLIEWICFSRRPLTTDELQWAMAVQPDRTQKSLEECQNSEDFIADENVDRRIKTLSCGLAEIVPSTNARVVQFIHQSVKDYFVERGLSLLHETGPPELLGPAAHCRLSRSCIRYFEMAVLSHSGPFRLEDQSRFPLLHYVTTSWVSHMKLGEAAEISPNDLLDLLGRSIEPLVESWVQIYETSEPYDVDCPASGSNVVHIVARHGLTKMLSCLLLAAGKVDFDAEDTDGRTPLSWAAEKGHEAVANLLLDTGKVDVDVRDNKGRTPLLWAVEDGREAVVKLLLDTGKIDVDVRDNKGRTPLSWAVMRGREAVIKLLLDTGKVDVDGRTPLSWAAEGSYWAGEDGSEAVVKLLLDTGEGRMPLSWAVMRGREAVIKLLLDTGKVDVDVRDNKGRTPLSWAAEGSYWAGEDGSEAVVKLLLDTGEVDIDARDNEGRTPLSWATKGNIWAVGDRCKAVVKLLLDIGMVNIDVRDNKGQTPLSWAAQYGLEAMVKLLLDISKVDVDARDTNSRTPLSWAAQYGHEAVLKLLLATGKVDVDARDNEGRTPLSWAAEKGHEAVVNLLLDTGKANVDVEDFYSLTAYQLSVFNNHEQVEHALAARGALVSSDLYGLQSLFSDRAT
ncbi:unnamed protein product [Clonostachys rosea f. rosea IK726]|uniref:Uncharacterized protein n=1 Tax=Clonostachys rosea f. rosea IK726 TaxID=1349383 RepID=A0ACA9TEM7_BIOOC|nr:unnamed protein product [Clonostachys rosea f. rosea IK726]